MLLMEFMMVLDEHKSEFVPELSTIEESGYNEDIMRRMISVTDYIKNNLTADDLSQTTMAKMAGISREYFSRVFKSVTGTNYSKWLNMIRMEKATELLIKDNRPLTEIAMLSGFAYFLFSSTHLRALTKASIQGDTSSFLRSSG